MTQNQIVLSILTGVLLGVIYTVFSVFKIIFKKNYLSFILDFTFIAMVFVITFVIALVVNYAHLRLMQVIFELIAFWSVIFLFDEVINQFNNIIPKNKV